MFAPKYFTSMTATKYILKELSIVHMIQITIQCQRACILHDNQTTELTRFCIV